jgi:hypothetical protein
MRALWNSVVGRDADDLAVIDDDSPFAQQGRRTDGNYGDISDRDRVRRCGAAPNGYGSGAPC